MIYYPKSNIPKYWDNGIYLKFRTSEFSLHIAISANPFCLLTRLISFMKETLNMKCYFTEEKKQLFYI